MPPFLVSDLGDVDVSPTLSGVAASVEIYDLPGCEFFDAKGRRITASADGYRVVLAPSEPAVYEPERLELLLRNYFRRLNPALASFTDAADRAAALDELVRLRQALAECRHQRWLDRCAKLWARLLRRA
jgi:hypothetical protein